MYNSTTHMTVDGRRRRLMKSFEEVSQKLEWCYSRDLENTDYGLWLQDEYARLYPKRQYRPCAMSELDLY